MKYKTTKRNVMNGYSNVISVGYCDFQSLLRCKEPIAYTSGVYGWNADVYDFGNVAIVTGYRPFGNTYPENRFELIRKYEDEAKAFAYDWDVPYDEKAIKLDKLIHNFIMEMTAEA